MEVGMTTDIFLRSYAADLPWVPYALRSIHRFVTGIRDIVIVVPANDYERFKSLNLTKEILCSSRLSGSEGRTDGYLVQQMDKLVADLYTEAETILFWDSDVVAIRPFSPSSLFVAGDPRCLMTPYSKLLNADGSQATPWQSIAEKALGHYVEYEYMRSHPFLVPRDALIGFRTYMQNLHEISLVEYIERQPNRAFSEFNCLLAWAHHHAPDYFSWWNTEEKGVPQPFVKQYHSWSGITPEIRAEMEDLLA